MMYKLKQSQLGKIIIYCDSQAFLELVTVLKTMLPFVDSDSIQKIIDIYLFNERIIANTQLQPTHTLDLTQLNESLEMLQIF